MVELEQGPRQHHVLTVTSLHYKESVIEYVHVGIGVGEGGGECGDSGDWEVLVQEKEKGCRKSTQEGREKT